jgi:hypothetical protein
VTASASKEMMMNSVSHPVTVYFDTNFYVWLCRADESLSATVLQALNELDIRVVISDVIIRELLTSRDRNELDIKLVDRVNRLRQPSYQTRDGLAWEVLLLAGEERVAMANFLRWAHDLTTVAESLSMMARRETTDEETAELIEGAKPYLRDIGFPEDFGQDPGLAATTLLAMFNIEGVEWPKNPTREDCERISAQIFGILGTDIVEQLREDDQIKDSTTRSEDRPFKVAAGKATDKEKKGLSNTLRDTDRMMDFVSHVDQIDFLQVDHAQQAIISDSKPSHRLAELGLAERCFSINSLSDAVEKLRKLTSMC